ncbi:uncharacterized protein ACHE_80230S [Aspergillus chevalieri]|uniref:Uncharacterized protein n=1 Tax=Aspergillus chevalieri TaxID=182096 RepID=A0A7R7ZRQ4_ASPCH|nr:uncharacterized protein ACHE_80230S [Aspergillus chevalieri]BCR92330.1 hypothetical protein ACHE_80230S [Aspergillus chevalieri]
MALVGPEVVEDCQLAIKTAKFESEYAKISGRMAQLLDAERTRVKHMEQLLLQFENDTLRSELDQVNGRLATVMQAESDNCLQCHEAWKEVDRLRSIIKASSHEIEGLHEKLSSLGDTTFESRDLLAEKTRLSKDLSRLQTEFERMRSQNASLQDLLAEKRDLERQLSIQMEDDKRTHECSQARDMQQKQEIANLTSQLEKARKELAEGAGTVERQEHNSQRQSLEWTTQRNTYERKIETLTKKLKSTKSQLEEAQKPQQNRQADVTTDDTSKASHRGRAIPQQPMAQFNPDITIATPGAIQKHEKARQPSALPGDKSAFSITPYLSRTNAPLDTPVSSEDDMDELGAVDLKETIESPSNEAGSGGSKDVDTGKGLPRKTAKQKQTKLQAKESSAKGPGRVDSDDQLEDLSGLHAQKGTGHGPAKPKKRKLGGQRDRNLFDEEEDELHEYRKPGRKLALGAGRNLALGGFQPAGGLQAFSPLKRDRKRH